MTHEKSLPRTGNIVLVSLLYRTSGESKHLLWADRAHETKVWRTEACKNEFSSVRCVFNSPVNCYEQAKSIPLRRKRCRSAVNLHVECEIFSPKMSSSDNTSLSALCRPIGALVFSL